MVLATPRQNVYACARLNISGLFFQSHFPVRSNSPSRLGCHYRQNSAIVTFVNGASNFVYGAFVFINGASVFINGASVFVNGASNFVYGAFVFINGASNFQCQKADSLAKEGSTWCKTTQNVPRHRPLLLVL